jgi:hypothetical protein
MTREKDEPRGKAPITELVFPDLPQARGRHAAVLLLSTHRPQAKPQS